MTYKGSSWTRGDLGGGPDYNPGIACHDCGERFPWLDYWKPRVLEGDRVDSPESGEPWRCDHCHRVEERRQKNVALDCFIASGGADL